MSTGLCKHRHGSAQTARLRSGKLEGRTHSVWGPARRLKGHLREAALGEVRKEAVRGRARSEEIRKSPRHPSEEAS